MNELVVDRKAVLETFDNNAEFLKSVIGTFLADSPGQLAAVRAAVAANNLSEVMKAAHSLKGSVSVFSAKSAAAAAQNLESMGREGKQEGLGEALAALEREMALVTSELQEIAKETV
jgi:HPt (histidine-containing phosphotransfer) domain-containing protein